MEASSFTSDARVGGTWIETQEKREQENNST